FSNGFTRTQHQHRRSTDCSPAAAGSFGSASFRDASGDAPAGAGQEHAQGCFRSFIARQPGAFLRRCLRLPGRRRPRGGGPWCSGADAACGSQGPKRPRSQGTEGLPPAASRE
ncbi:hemA, partial [Symbiodinium sp. CCMP2456]